MSSFTFPLFTSKATYSPDYFDNHIESGAIENNHSQEREDPRTQSGRGSGILQRVPEWNSNGEWMFPVRSRPLVSFSREGYPVLPLDQQPPQNQQPPVDLVSVFNTRMLSSVTKTKQKTTYQTLLESAELDGSEDDWSDVVPKGNIILDMDGTLGDNIPRHFPESNNRFIEMPIPRPGLKRFLRFVFAHYERVSIWTAAYPQWYNRFKSQILIPNMPPGKEFHFERTAIQGEPRLTLKPLRAIYGKYPEYTSENTTIVDDNPETFRDNVENAVHILSFFYDTFGHSVEIRRMRALADRELFRAIETLKSRR